MARPRKPTNVLKITGAAQAHPERIRARAEEPIDDRPLGPPPEWLRPDQKVAWLEIERLAPWLAQADRLAVEVTAVLLVTFRVAQSSMTPALVTRLEAMLGRLGLTPADRSKVTIGSPGKSNRFAERGVRKS